MTIKAIIIDDEAFVRDHVREILEENYSKEIVVVAEAHGVEKGLEAIEKFDPDLLFLDVNMGDGTGFDLLDKIPQKNFDLIFITGFDEHAIKAIKVGALDYILKPIDDDELLAAIDKSVNSRQSDSHLEKLLEVSGEYFRGSEKKRVILKTTDTVYAIYEDDIIYCRSDGNYTTFYTRQMEKIVVSKPLKKIEEILSESHFIRCHQSYIVNKQHVLKYNKKGVLIVHMDIQVPVSSRRKDYTLKMIFD
ncbi:LytR/AlgR family response regulator transcription factor [Gilvibacter sediminis]|uniref:LytR/AlgR family response regulator transcription factor n=1 Tax=Gilvibacter sediminis TaxID=379071 RepID=UPI0023501E8B|nr:LytTR family DNA-binding domain-containing protein [Gilvibacter sediminis]MDC7997407.1 LytTR family DNA-binding domain-containing protein [Gilvibacter sediminis]